MSSRNRVILKHGWQNSQHTRVPSHHIYLEKQDRKMQNQYSPKGIPINVVKYYRSNAINRHASQEEFKRFAEEPAQIISHAGNNVEQLQNYHHRYLRMDNNNYNHSQEDIHQMSNQPNRNQLKVVVSSTSIDHSVNRHTSPHSYCCSPRFLKSKPKSTQKESYLPRKMMIENFKKLKKLGEGKFGKVYLVQQIHSGFMMALKIMEKRKIIQDNILQQFIRQVKIQAYLTHPNIIDVYGFFHDETYFYTLLQLGCDGQLYNIIAQHKYLTEQATSFITKNLLKAVNCMHENQILHRDIKPENIVLIMGNVKLCDFGWAVNKIKKQELRSTFCGTPLYLSPELLRGQRYDQKVDLWAIGILAYELLVGNSPFEINQQQDLIKILTEEIKFPKTKKISLEFQQFIHHILNKNPKERLPSNQLLQLPFIHKYEQLETCQQLCG